MLPPDWKMHLGLQRKNLDCYRYTCWRVALACFRLTMIISVISNRVEVKAHSKGRVDDY